MPNGCYPPSSPPYLSGFAQPRWASERGSWPGRTRIRRGHWTPSLGLFGAVGRLACEHSTVGPNRRFRTAITCGCCVWRGGRVRLMATVSKTVMGASPSRVRIPASPPISNSGRLLRRAALVDRVSLRGRFCCIPRRKDCLHAFRNLDVQGRHDMYSATTIPRGDRQTDRLRHSPQRPKDDRCGRLASHSKNAADGHRRQQRGQQNAWHSDDGETHARTGGTGMLHVSPRSRSSVESICRGEQKVTKRLEPDAPAVEAADDAVDRSPLPDRGRL